MLATIRKPPQFPLSSVPTPSGEDMRRRLPAAEPQPQLRGATVPLKDSS